MELHSYLYLWGCGESWGIYPMLQYHCQQQVQVRMMVTILAWLATDPTIAAGCTFYLNLNISNTFFSRLNVFGLTNISSGAETWLSEESGWNPSKMSGQASQANEGEKPWWPWSYVVWMQNSWWQLCNSILLLSPNGLYLSPPLTLTHKMLTPICVHKCTIRWN